MKDNKMKPASCRIRIGIVLNLAAIVVAALCGCTAESPEAGKSGGKVAIKPITELVKPPYFMSMNAIDTANPEKGFILDASYANENKWEHKIYLYFLSGTLIPIAEEDDKYYIPYLSDGFCFIIVLTKEIKPVELIIIEGSSKRRIELPGDKLFQVRPGVVEDINQIIFPSYDKMMALNLSDASLKTLYEAEKPSRLSHYILKMKDNIVLEEMLDGEMEIKTLNLKDGNVRTIGAIHTDHKGQLSMSSLLQPSMEQINIGKIVDCGGNIVIQTSRNTIAIINPTDGSVKTRNFDFQGTLSAPFGESGVVISETLDDGASVKSFGNSIYVFDIKDQRIVKRTYRGAEELHVSALTSDGENIYIYYSTNREAGIIVDDLHDYSIRPLIQYKEPL